MNEQERAFQHLDEQKQMNRKGEKISNGEVLFAWIKESLST